MTFIPDWKIADDGWPVLALAGIVTILTSMIFLPLGCFFLGIMMWLAHGLRLPSRQTKADDQIIYAPADGVVLDIETDQFPDGLAVMMPARQTHHHSNAFDRYAIANKPDHRPYCRKFAVTRFVSQMGV